MTPVGFNTFLADQEVDRWANRGYEFTGPADLARHDLVSAVRLHGRDSRPYNHISDGAAFSPPPARYIEQRYPRRNAARDNSPVYADARASMPVGRFGPERGPARSRGQEEGAFIGFGEGAVPASTLQASQGPTERLSSREEKRIPNTSAESHDTPTPAALREHGADPERERMTRLEHDEAEDDVRPPPDARWTKIARRLVDPDVLIMGRERFEVRDDFVIVLRVLSKAEVEAYSLATVQLRG